MNVFFSKNLFHPELFQRGCYVHSFFFLYWKITHISPSSVLVPQSCPNRLYSLFLPVFTFHSGKWRPFQQHRLIHQHAVHEPFRKDRNTYKNMCFVLLTNIFICVIMSLSVGNTNEKLFIKGGLENTKIWWVVWSKLRGKSPSIQLPTKKGVLP